jgi:hypothetical protein
MTILSADALKTDPRGLALLEEAFAPANGRRRRTPRFVDSFRCAEIRPKLAARNTPVKTPEAFAEAL